MKPTSTLFVGIDVSRDTNQICALNFNQDVFFNRTYKNTPKDSNLLIDQIVSILDKQQLSSILVVMESTSLYFFHIANFISTAQALSSFDTKIYCINPKTIHNYMKSYNEMPKNDFKDAWALADFGRVGRCKHLSEWRGASYVALQRLTRYRFHLSQNLSKEKLYVLNNIYLKFSNLKKKSGKNDHVNPFSSLFGATAKAVLTEFFSIDEIIQMPFDDLVNFLNEKSRNRFANSDDVARLLKKSAQDSYRLDKLSYDALNITIASNLRMIAMLKKELKNLDKQILDFSKSLNSNAMTVLTSIPGVGPVYAAGIISEIGDISFFKNDSALAKYAGFAWGDNSSGSFISEDNKMIKSANVFLKYYLSEACNMMRHNDSVMASYYSKKYHESSTHKHKRALVLSTRKFIRLVHTLLRNDKLYVNPLTGEVKNQN